MTAIALPRTSPLIRALWVDAVLCGAFGVLMTAAAGPLGDLMSLPTPFVRWVGIILLPIAAFVAYLASRPVPPRAGVWTLIAINALWAVDSIAVLFTGWLDPNPLGIAFIVAQALLVGGIAEFQYMGLRRVRS
ncbi:hypothetical protein [Streptosporangium sp. KLBMP 9127]|nr:hypothetical protein [Streptosporangium sp. KLBMP 9127]